MLAHVKPTTWPLLASVAAIVVSPLLQVATGQGAFYTLWLAVMMVVLWWAQRLTRREVGVVPGDSAAYLAALAYVFVIIGLVAVGAWLAGLVNLANYSGSTVVRRLSLNFLITFVLALITEEGFFRGALWGSCVRAGFSPVKTIVWTSVAFGLWHLAVPFIDAEFAQPASKVPQYVIGSTAFGVAMGLLRLRSGSILVTSACHALWNATAYTFFGTGEKAGQLGIADASLWDPERGYVGLVLVIAAAAVMWWWVKPASRTTLHGT